MANSNDNIEGAHTNESATSALTKHSTVTQQIVRAFDLNEVHDSEDRSKTMLEPSMARAFESSITH